MYETDYTTSGDTGASSTAKETARQATGSAKQAASEVTGTVKEQGRQVAGEVKGQVRSVASDVRQSVAGQVRTGHGKLAESVRKFSDELGGMSGADANSPVGQVVSRVSDTGRRAADYLDERGPEGLLTDVQDFARRKPGTFLLGMAAAGFVIGRLGRTTIAAAQDNDTPTATPTGTQGLYAGTGYDATTATGYGTAAGGYDTATTGYATPPATGATFVEDAYTTPGYDTRTADVTAVGTAPVDPTVDPDPVRYDQSGYPIGTSR